MRILLFFSLLFSLIAISSCTKEDQPPLEAKKSPPKASTILSNSGDFKAYPQVNIPDNNRELQILKQQPEYQSALDSGINGSWKKVPCNLVGMCILIQKNIDNLSYDNGVTIWFMDTLTVNNTPSRTFGSRYFYDLPNNTNGTFTGKEYLYSPYSNNYVRFDTYVNDIFNVSNENPDLPSYPELRPWANNDECFKTMKNINAQMGNVLIPDWWVRFNCAIEILFDVDSDQRRQWAETGIPPILIRN